MGGQQPAHLQATRATQARLRARERARAGQGSVPTPGNDPRSGLKRGSDGPRPAGGWVLRARYVRGVQVRADGPRWALKCHDMHRCLCSWAKSRDAGSGDGRWLRLRRHCRLPTASRPSTSPPFPLAKHTAQSHHLQDDHAAAAARACSATCGKRARASLGGLGGLGPRPGGRSRPRSGRSELREAAIAMPCEYLAATATSRHASASRCRNVLRDSSACDKILRAPSRSTGALRRGAVQTEPPAPS